MLSEFDQEFESLVIPFPKNDNLANGSIFAAFEQEFVALNNAYQNEQNTATVVAATPSAVAVEDSATKLKKIEALATEMSAERYSPNYNPEICLANLLNFILSKDLDQETEDNFFQLLNEERNVDLNEALNDFDFYIDNPYKKKAEKILSKIEARKNKWT